MLVVVIVVVVRFDACIALANTSTTNAAQLGFHARDGTAILSRVWISRALCAHLRGFFDLKVSPRKV